MNNTERAAKVGVIVFIVVLIICYIIEVSNGDLTPEGIVPLTLINIFISFGISFSVMLVYLENNISKK